MTSRSLSGSRRLRALVASSLLALGMLTTSAAAWGGDGRQGGRAPRAHAMRGGGAYAGRPVRQERELGALRGPRDVQQFMPQQAYPVERPAEMAQPPGRPGRLTPDERRALRQQINDAGRDLYRSPRP